MLRCWLPHNLPPFLLTLALTMSTALDLPLPPFFLRPRISAASPESLLICSGVAHILQLLSSGDHGVGLRRAPTAVPSLVDVVDIHFMIYVCTCLVTRVVAIDKTITFNFSLHCQCQHLSQPSPLVPTEFEM